MKLPVLPVYVRGSEGYEHPSGWAKTRRSAATTANGEIFAVNGTLSMVAVSAENVVKEPGCTLCGRGLRFVVVV